MPVKEKRFMVIGDKGCGKTSILKATKCQVNRELPTVYFKFITGIKTKKNKEKKKNAILVSFWDMPALGGDELNCTREALYPKLDAALLVFSIDDRKSLNDVKEKWYPQLRKYCNRKVPVIVVGNKTDLREDPDLRDEALSYDEGLKVAEKIKAYAYVECSALLDENIMEVFKFAIKSVVKKTTYVM